MSKLQTVDSILFSFFFSFSFLFYQNLELRYTSYISYTTVTESHDMEKVLEQMMLYNMVTVC